MFAFLAWRDVYYPAFDADIWFFWTAFCWVAFAVPAVRYVYKNKKPLNALGYRFDE
jgi:hypothetical protein